MKQQMNEEKTGERDMKVVISTQRCPPREYKGYRYSSSDVVDVDLFVFSELECALAVLFAEGLGLVDLRVFGKLAVRFHCEKGK